MDLVGFTAATEAHGDELAATLALRLADIADDACEAGERLVKSIGDAVLCSTPRPEAGLRLAAAIVQAVTVEPRFPALRTGLHHGAATERRGDVFGAAVNLICRVAEAATPGQSLATAVVASTALALGLPTSSIGHRRLKNIHEPVELFEVDLLCESCDLDLRVDPVCRMRVDPTSSVAWKGPDDLTNWFCSEECLAVFRHRAGR